MRKQKRVSEKIAEYGIREYSKLQLSLHKDIMNLLKLEKYKEISADDCMVVFGRVYSTYVLAQLKKEGKLKVKR